MFKDVNKVQKVCQYCIEMHPEFKRIYAKALQKLSNPSKAKDAKALFLELTQMSTSNADLCFYLCRCDAELKHFESALSYLEKALTFGYSDYRALNFDPDLAKVRELPGFDSILSKYRASSPRGGANNVSTPPALKNAPYTKEAWYKDFDPH